MSKPNQVKRRQLRMETLEPRQMLAADLVISEFMASNSDTLLDDYGRSSDWIEIFNAGDLAADLTNYSLTDSASPANIDKWVFPAGTTIDAGDYLLVFAEDDANLTDEFNLYTGYRLSAGGEFIGLYDNTQTLLSSFAADGSDYPAQQTDVSYGLAFDVPAPPALETLIGKSPAEGNGSFEDLTGATPNLGGNRIGGNTNGSIPGWTSERLDGFTGWDDDNTASDGAEYAFVNAGARAIFSSDPLATNLIAGESLELSFDAGNNVIGASVIYRVSLQFGTGGQATFAEVTSTNSGGYEKLTFAHTVSGAQAGANTVSVVIDMDNTGSEVDQPRFDNVELKKSPLPAIELIAAGGNARVLVPTNNSVDAIWRDPSFDDSGWFFGPTPFGYEDALGSSNSFQDLFLPTGSDGFDGTDLTDDLPGTPNRLPTAYLRYEFNIDNAAAINDLLLELQYEDGFVAYLNGDNTVAAENEPASPQYDSTTPGAVTHPDGDALQFQPFSLNANLDKLVDGTNVLAIHLVNATAGSSDMLLNARLTAQQSPPAESWNNLESFDSVTAPALPGGWTTTSTASNAWQTGNTGSFAGPNRAFVVDPDSQSESELVSPSISVTEETSKVRFQNFYDTEATWDGGVLEISTDGGATFQDILVAGGTFFSGGYNSAINSGAGSALAGRDAWSGNSGGYVETVVQLPESVYETDIQLRWRFASDGTVAGVAWSIDSLEQVLIEPAEDNTSGPTLREPREAGFLQTPTPGAANTDLRASGVVFSRDSSIFTAAFALTLTSDVPNEAIRYTLDGSLPTASSPLFTSPINIAQSTQVRARAFTSTGQSGVVFGETYELIESSLTGFTSNLPILVLDNYGAGNPLNKAFNSTFLATYEPDEVTGLTTLTDTATLATSAATHRRGSSSFTFGKNNIRIELRDQTGEDENSSLLGMPSESDWVLTTFARFDRAMIRNPIALDTNRQADVYAPRYQYVEVFFNQDGDALEESDYFGVYILEENIKRDSERVDIANLEPTDNSGEAITGGYIIKSDRTGGGDFAFQTTRGFPSEGSASFVVDDPNGSELTTQQRSYIQNYVQDFEDALFGADFKDSLGRSYEEFIDVDSFIEQHIFQTFFKGPDALRFSTYFHKDRGEKLKMGPNWDQERVAGVETDTGTNRARNPENWYGDGSITPLFEYDWWDRLFDDPNFMQRWVDRWEEFRTSIYNDANINTTIDSYVAQLLGTNPLSSPVTRNFIRWGDDASNGSGGNDNNGAEAWPNARVATSTNPSSNNFYQFADPAITAGATDPAISPTPENILAYWQSEVDHVRNWIEMRIDWVYGQLSEVAGFTVAEGVVSPGTQVNLTLPSTTSGSAQVWYTTDGTDPRDSAEGNVGSPSSTATLWDGNAIAINSTTQLTVRILDSNIQNPKDQVQSQSNAFDIWSAPSEALYEVGGNVANDLVISEINYNPTDATPQEVAAYAAITTTPISDFDLANDDFEFIEILNTSATDSLNLAGTQFADGVTFTFGNDSLLPGERAVVVEDVEAFEARYGSGIRVLGQWNGGLSAGGEKIAVLNNLGLEVMELTYNNNDPWSIAADGAGATLVLDDPASTPPSELGKYYRWRSSAEFGGTPGSAETPLAGVMINEVLAHTDPPEMDAIELYNPTTSDINLGGWFLSDSAETLKKFAIPANTVILAGGYLLFDESDFNPTPTTPGPTDFALDALGEKVFLTNPNGGGAGVTTFVDSASFDATFNGESLGRAPNGSGRLAPMLVTTLGAANSAARIGSVVISEVNYHPSDPSTAAQQAFQALAEAGQTLIDNDLEFIEIYNPTTTTISLDNWKLRGESDFDFPTGVSLIPQAALVVVTFNPATDAAKAAGFRAHYAIGPEIALVGPLDGQLNNSFGRVELEQPDTTDAINLPGVTSDEVLYDDLGPWPVDADGGGVSLTRLSANAYGNAATSWQGSTPTPGQVSLIQPLPGDYDRNGTVETADLTLWRNSFGSTTLLDADGNQNGVVDAADYTVWRDNLGATQAAVVATASAVIEAVTPEEIVPQPADMLDDSTGRYFAALEKVALASRTPEAKPATTILAVALEEPRLAINTESAPSQSSRSDSDSEEIVEIAFAELGDQPLEKQLPIGDLFAEQDFPGDINGLGDI